MLNRYIDSDNISSAFSFGFGLLLVSYFKPNIFIANTTIGLIFLIIGICSVNAYSIKNIARTLRLFYFIFIPVEIIIAVLTLNNIDFSDFIKITFVIAFANLIIISVLKRRLSILKKGDKNE